MEIINFKMNDLKNSFKDFHHLNILKNIKEKIKLNKDEDQDLFVKKDLKDNLFHLNYSKNISSQNEFEENFFGEYNNTIYIYYNSTIQYFKSCYYDSLYTPNSRNFLPKIKKDKFQFEKQMLYKNNKNINFFIDNDKNKQINNNIDYNYNYSLNQNAICDLTQNLEILDKNIININLNPKKSKMKNNSYFFDPNNITKNNSKNSENENESLSTSDKTSPTISERPEKATNFFSLDLKNSDENSNFTDGEYLVEMFGKKGWICILCNNFNYQTRVKCNRCGVIKKPKCIMNKKIKNENKNYDFKERCNKKGDWICSNCKNLNYSFRTICNRCKFPIINYYVINQINSNNSKNENFINNNNNHNIHPYCISPTFIVFNNIPNIFINNYGHNRNYEK